MLPISPVTIKPYSNTVKYGILITNEFIATFVQFFAGANTYYGPMTFIAIGMDIYMSLLFDAIGLDFIHWYSKSSVNSICVLLTYICSNLPLPRFNHSVRSSLSSHLFNSFFDGNVVMIVSYIL